MRGSHLPLPKFSLQSVKFSLRYAMRIMFGMFPCAVFVFSTRKCEADIFVKVWLAYMHSRPLDYLGTNLHRAHVLCIHACIMHA